jgi:hypothetical protein
LKYDAAVPGICSANGDCIYDAGGYLDLLDGAL